MERHLSLRFSSCPLPSRCILGFESDASRAHWGPAVRDAWILHFVLSGKGWFNGSPLQAGEGFVIRPGKLHEYHADETDGWNYFWVILPDPQSDSLLKEYGIFQNTDFFRFTFPAHFPALYIAYLTSSHAADPQQSFSLLTLLLSSIEKEPASAPTDRGLLYVQQAQEYMRLHYHRKLTVSAIAQALFLDEGYLYNLFIHHQGRSPKACLNQIRLETACKLLKQTELLISEIGRSVGYEDVLQFSRFFKSHIGISPRHYRKQP